MIIRIFRLLRILILSKNIGREKEFIIYKYSEKSRAEKEYIDIQNISAGIKNSGYKKTLYIDIQ